jgi:hypothetical protein
MLGEGTQLGGCETCSQCGGHGRGKLALRSSQSRGDRDRRELALLATELGMRERSPERSLDQRPE